ncbi:hypothetical protein [Comamonas aquatica]|uniref:hypothetical protein n=1 Tax=Comamonas aquatica TaxID=225991 RepID=UPI0028D5C119|nr:hypothetical protein [Comamonas aquatica]
MTNDCKTCPVSTGTHKPAEALHQIDEPLAEALLELAAYRFTVENREARIAELESQLDAIGAGGVEPLRKPAAAPPAVQAAVPEAIEQMAVDRYKVVPSHESMFHRWAVVAGNGTQQLYIGREGECQNMARKFMGAFLDGSFVAMQNAATAHPAEEVSTLNLEAIEMPTNPHSAAGDPVAHIAWAAGAGAVFAAVETALAATQPAAQAVQPFGWLITKSKLPGDVEFTQDPARENLARSFGYQTQALYDQPAAQGMDAEIQQAVEAERERICAAIKAEDDHCVDQGDYMLDSNDCIKIVRGKWVRPDYSLDAAQAKQGGAHAT